MSQASDILCTVCNASFVGFSSGGIAVAVTFGRRCVSKLPQLSYKAAAWTAAGFSVAALVADVAHKQKLISDDTFQFGIFIGGAVLGTAANKIWARSDLSILSNAATPTITAIILCVIVKATV